MRTNFLSENQCRRDHFGDLDVQERIFLKVEVKLSVWLTKNHATETC